MAIRVYDRRIFDNNPDLLGGVDWGNVIGQVGAAGAQTGLALLFGNQQGQSGGACRAPAGCLQCRMTGRGDIAGCIDLLAQQYQQAEASGAPPERLLQLATEILAALNNDQFFAQGGDGYLASAKGTFQNTIRVMQGRAQQAGATSQTTAQTVRVTVVDPVTGKTVTVPVALPPPATAAGISTTTILMVGAGLGLILLMKK